MAAPREIRHRVLAAILCRLSGQRYRPRFDPLRRLADDLSAGGKGGVLHGCRITRGRHVAIAAAAPTAVLRVGRVVAKQALVTRGHEDTPLLVDDEPVGADRAIGAGRDQIRERRAQPDGEDDGADGVGGGLDGTEPRVAG